MLCKNPCGFDGDASICWFKYRLVRNYEMVVFRFNQNCCFVVLLEFELSRMVITVISWFSSSIGSSRMGLLLDAMFISAGVLCCAPLWALSLVVLSCFHFLALYVRWIILSMDFFLGPGRAIRFFWEFEVKLVMGLRCGESNTRLITSTLSDFFHDSRSVLIRGDFLFGCRGLRFACSTFDCANSACFDLVSNCEGFLMLPRIVGFSVFVLGLSVVPLRVVFFCVIEPLGFDGPGCSLSLFCPQWILAKPPVEKLSFVFFLLIVTFVHLKKCFFFSLFRFSCPTVLHANKSISCGFVSVLLLYYSCGLL